jgi:ABC-type branched-subunit amino acid transport system permease subunit
MLIYGAVLVIIMVIRPEGILGNRELPSFFRRFLRRDSR